MLLLLACNKDDNPISGDAKEGGLFDVLTSAIIYNLGDMEISNPLELKYFQGNGSKISKINIYQQYFNTDAEGDAISSDVKLFKSVDLSSFSTPGFINSSVSFKELAKATSVGGVALDTIDANVKSGFYWILSYKAVLEDGREVSIPKTTIFVNAKYAGNYKIVEKQYYRIDDLRDDLDPLWDETINISALNANTYIICCKIGPFEGAGRLIFEINDVEGATELPLKYFKTYDPFGALLLNDQPIAVCPDDAGSLANVGSCDPNKNILKLMSGGKDSLIMTFGYVTPGSGPRSFYQKLVKL